MCRCRPHLRRPRATPILLLLACLGVGVAPFPMAAQAKSLSETRAEQSAETKARLAAKALDETLHAAADLDPVSELPDLREKPAGPKRKQAFLELVVPLVEVENARIAAQREWLEALQARNASLTLEETSRLVSLCAEYRLECTGKNVPDQLLERVGTVPLSLVVVQAVEESGWGTSRLARLGNNLFGLRCFADGCGLAQRGGGRLYRSFDSVQQAVRTYLHNLNTHKAYAKLRKQRTQLAGQGQQITAEDLIQALDGYAVREDYQDVLLSLLRSNENLIERHRRDRAA